MRSTTYVDFSVRQNKAIERSVVFDGLRQLRQTLLPAESVYVGFGSVWFVDFDSAHRELGLNSLISIEIDEITYRRALFNKPFRTVEVLSGPSHDVIPDMLENRPELGGRPWIVWLDYDEVLDETKIDEIAFLIGNLPDDSVLLTTFSAAAGRYSKTWADLGARMLELFGDAFPIERFPSIRRFKDEGQFMLGLADAAMDVMASRFIHSARPGKFSPSFKLAYQDGTPMVTVGGILAAPGSVGTVETVVGAPEWRGVAPSPIVTPPLTQREVSALRSLLPAASGVARSEVQALGFDLAEEHIQAFSDHYLRYPTFVQSVR